MADTYRNFSASVTFPNTPESDALEFVTHTVNYTKEGEGPQSMDIMARDPSDAIERVRRYLKAS